MANTVERRIYFYRVVPCRAAGGPNCPFDPSATLNRIASLGNDLRLTLSDGDYLCCWVLLNQERPSVILGHSRLNGLPRVENDGQLSELSLPARAALSEAIHAVFFVEPAHRTTIIGSDFNFYGPRINRLREYFLTKARGVCPDFEIHTLTQKNITRQLAQLETIRMVRISAHPAAIEIIREADETLGDAFVATKRIVAPEDHPDSAEQHALKLEIALSVGNKRSANLGIRDRISRIIARPELIHSGTETQLSDLEVRGVLARTHKTDTVDLLADKLISKSKILTSATRSRALDINSAILAIQEAYEGLRDELLVAVGINEEQ